MRPLARYLGVDDLIANRLEFVDSYATGKLEKPFVAGATKADIMRDVRQAARHRPRRVVGVLRQLLRLPDARRRRPPDRVQPRLPAALDRALATTGRCSISTRNPHARRAAPAGLAPVRSSDRKDTLMRAIRPKTPLARARAHRHHRHRLGAAHHVLRREPPDRGSPGRHARHLPEAADDRRSPTRGRDPLRAQPPRGHASRCTRCSSRG